VAENFKHYRAPFIYTEFGCTMAREFTQVPIMMDEMSDFLSGGLVYEYSDHGGGSGYGLVVNRATSCNSWTPVLTWKDEAKSLQRQYNATGQYESRASNLGDWSEADRCTWRPSTVEVHEQPPCATWQFDTWSLELPPTPPEYAIPVHCPANNVLTQTELKENLCFGTGTQAPSVSPGPSFLPVPAPSPQPSQTPSAHPTPPPTLTQKPTFAPTATPTLPPTQTLTPTLAPTATPSRSPVPAPIPRPTFFPTHSLPPTLATELPSQEPSHLPLIPPTPLPTIVPTHAPTHYAPPTPAARLPGAADLHDSRDDDDASGKKTTAPGYASAATVGILLVALVGFGGLVAVAAMTAKAVQKRRRRVRAAVEADFGLKTADRSGSFGEGVVMVTTTTTTTSNNETAGEGGGRRSSSGGSGAGSGLRFSNSASPPPTRPSSSSSTSPAEILVYYGDARKSESVATSPFHTSARGAADQGGGGGGGGAGSGAAEGCGGRDSGVGLRASDFERRTPPRQQEHTQAAEWRRNSRGARSSPQPTKEAGVPVHKTVNYV
jgi:hypothetical protein